MFNKKQNTEPKMTEIIYKAQPNNKKSQNILGMKLYTGLYIVYENGIYLYSKYCNISRFEKNEAIEDAKKLFLAL